MKPIDDDTLKLIVRYLDGELDDSERDAFERRLNEEAELREAIERLQDVDARVRAAHPPASPRPLPCVRRTVPPVLRAALIAILVLSAAALVYVKPWRPAITGVNASSAHAGFISDPTPSVVCDTNEKFIHYTRVYLGESIGANFDTPVTLIGWRKIDGADEPTRDRLLLARGERDEPIVVIFQQTQSPDPTLTEGDTLRAHRKPFGSVTAWEISANDEPSVLPLLELQR